MSQTAPPIYSNSTISVTCTRVSQKGLKVEVPFDLKGVPAEPAHYMRDGLDGAYLRYFMYVNAARTRYWGDGTQGTFPFQGTCFLDERNKVCTPPLCALRQGEWPAGPDPIRPLLRSRCQQIGIQL